MINEITRKTLLYESNVEYADFCINHIEGCAHGCTYPCYAMMMKKRCGIIKDYNDWIKPKIVANALELLEKEIPKYKFKIKSVHLCFSTDPFMYNYPEVVDLTLKIIERLNKDNIYCTTLTKGIYPKDLVNTNKYSKKNKYGFTLVSLSKKFKNTYEPFTAPYKERIASLKTLANLGLKTWVSMEPYPTPNLIKQNLLEILKEISFVDEIVFGKLNYNVVSNQFYENKEFYQNCAEIVIKFCRDNKIKYHIKQGTLIDNCNNKTKMIFIKNYNKKNIEYLKQPAF